MKTVSNDLFVHKEGGYGWIVVLTASYNLGVIVGLNNNYALIYDEFLMVSTDKDQSIYAGKRKF